MKKNIFYRRLFLILGLVMAASEIAKQFCLTFSINHGTYNWWYFPFQLCSMPMYVLLVLPHVKQRRLSHALRVFLMCYSLLGGIAVFADTSGLHYPVTALTIHSYGWHILLIFLGLVIGRSFQEKLSWSMFRDATLLYLLFCLMATLINLAVSPYAVINMFYINPLLPMEQIIFRDLIPIIGNAGAILAYIGATILGAGILFSLFATIQKGRNMAKQTV
jgi:hypothetical protein